MGFEGSHALSPGAPNGLLHFTDAAAWQVSPSGTASLAPPCAQLLASSPALLVIIKAHIKAGDSQRGPTLFAVLEYGCARLLSGSFFNILT